ncbi:hydrogenase maturation peptidase HycI [bacterium]|nr:hydrogenase maturation peptidase HycI [bacterium]
MKKLLMGIGNQLRGDDGVGNYIAQNFQAEGWLALDCATLPENYTSVVKKHQPDYLVIVDAAQMDIKAGEFRRVDYEEIQDMGGGTHSLPLYIVINYMRQSVQKEVVFIGIQPAKVEDGQELTPVVRDSADRVIEMIRSDTFSQIPEL